MIPRVSSERGRGQDSGGRNEDAITTHPGLVALVLVMGVYASSIVWWLGRPANKSLRKR